MNFLGPGYILSGSSEKYYFNDNTDYEPTYDNKVKFKDTDGKNTVVTDNSFIHYNDGSIVALHDGVLMDLDTIDDDPIVYYNVNKNKEAKKMQYYYAIKNNDKDVKFTLAIWKIDNNKYILLGKNLTLGLNNGTEKKLRDYVEIEYFDNDIVNVYNQEVNYQTISTNSYITFDDSIKLNLGTKIVSKDNINKMSLDEMVINSDDNVTLADLSQNDENSIVENDVNNTTDENSVSNDITNDTENTDIANNGGTTGNVGGISYGGYSSSSGKTSGSSVSSYERKTTTEVQTNENQEKSSSGETSLKTQNIIYADYSQNENKVDESKAIDEPSFKLENMDVTAIGVSADIVITDENDMLSKDKNVEVKIRNNSTGNIVDSIEQPYGTMKIPINIQTLRPETGYTIIASATYKLDGKEYTKNFLYKTFVTSTIGVKIEKDMFTEESLSFNVSFTDSLTTEATVTLLDSNKKEVANQSKVVKKQKGDKQQVEFTSLNPNTDYIVRLNNIVYDGVAQGGTSWNIDVNAKTLKRKIEINKLNYSVDKRNDSFNLIIDDVKDEDDSLQSYKYEVYELIESTDSTGNSTSKYNIDNLVFSSETKDKQMTVKVDDNSLQKGKYYGFRVVATAYDNEKYVESVSSMCGAFTLTGVTFPTVKFERVESDYPPTQIYGWLYIIDNENTITVDKDNPLTVSLSSDVDESKVIIKRYSLDNDQVTKDKDNNDVIKILIDVGKDGSSTEGLKQETSYKFSVYASVNLRDGNDIYKNSYIGTCIETTGKYNDIDAKLTSVQSSSNTFEVDMGLER